MVTSHSNHGLSYSNHIICLHSIKLIPFFSVSLVMTAHQFLFTGGPIHVSFPSGLTLAEVQRKNPLVVRGGRYRPPDCEARHRTAIIIPHRHREHHLKFLLYYIHPFLQRQQLNYGIYVIHQVKDTHKQIIYCTLKEDSKGEWGILHLRCLVLVIYYYYFVN